jgi:hypothetical protein
MRGQFRSRARPARLPKVLRPMSGEACGEIRPDRDYKLDQKLAWPVLMVSSGVLAANNARNHRAATTKPRLSRSWCASCGSDVGRHGY